jgi:hypothetical protein
MAVGEKVEEVAMGGEEEGFAAVDGAAGMGADPLKDSGHGSSSRLMHQAQ